MVNISTVVSLHGGGSTSGAGPYIVGLPVAAIGSQAPSCPVPTNILAHVGTSLFQVAVMFHG